MPQLGQKPFSWFNFASQFGQRRLLSGTTASAIKDCRGSSEGNGSSWTRPAPIVRRELRCEARVERFEELLRPDRDFDDETEETAETLETAEERVEPAAPAGVAATSEAAPRGGRPQSSQIPSTILPEHPGRLHITSMVNRHYLSGIIASTGRRARFRNG